MISEIEKHLKSKSQIEVLSKLNVIDAASVIKNNPLLLHEIDLFQHNKVIYPNSNPSEVLDFMLDSYFKLNSNTPYLTLENSIIKIPNVLETEIGHCIDIKPFFTTKSPLNNLIVDCICCLYHFNDFPCWFNVHDISQQQEFIEEFYNDEDSEDTCYLDYVEEYTSGAAYIASNFIINNIPSYNSLIKRITNYLKKHPSNNCSNTLKLFRHIFIKHKNILLRDFLLDHENYELVFFVDHCHFSWNIDNDEDPFTQAFENDFQDKCENYDFQFPTLFTDFNKNADFSFITDILNLLKSFYSWKQL